MSRERAKTCIAISKAYLLALLGPLFLYLLADNHLRLFNGVAFGPLDGPFKPAQAGLTKAVEEA
jgi:hypothetical protein